MNLDFTDQSNLDETQTAPNAVRYLDHFQQPFVAKTDDAAIDSRALAATNGRAVAAATAQALAEQYLRAVAPDYNIDENMLPDADGSAAAFAGDNNQPASKLEIAEEKDVLGTTVISYQQTLNGLPVWNHGVSVTIQPEPMRVTASQSSVDSNVAAAANNSLDGAAASAAEFAPDKLKNDLPKLKSVLKAKSKSDLKINGTRELYYRYEPSERFHVEAELESESNGNLQECAPALPLAPVPDSIKPGELYKVTEVLFTLPLDNFGALNWRAFVEQNTGAVLYLRAFTTCATAMVYRTDPLTAGAGAGVVPTASAAVLNPFRTTVSLQGLTNANPQPLNGQFVRLIDNAAPVVAPPTQANPPATFAYNAPTREFAAANAYHHSDFLFRLVQGMGFNIASYFDGTTFPVPVDACAFSDALNARAPGNATGTGSGGFQYGLAATPFPAVSIAADLRVVLHEFGHAIMWDSVHSPNFGFAHSAGDSLAAIYLDPESALRNDPVRRFQTFPWVLPNRNHGRAVASGWGWGGANDTNGYNSEQILSSTHFRLYRSLGGDSSDVNRRKLAARQAMYLIFRATALLASSPITPTPNPAVWASRLMNADIGTANFEGYRGGAFHKVVRWSFEKQGLYRLIGAPNTTEGAPPAVDVYINDGRSGEYQYQPVHWECRDIWNRLAPSIGGGAGVHQTPIVGRINYAYVLVKNRGTQAAANLVVRGYSANPGAGLSFPGDWTPMLTAQIAVASPIPPGGSALVGPFRWRPRFVGHECMFMEASDDRDLSNIDSRTFFPCATGPTPEWRLVPFDNNLGQRNVVPVAGAGGIRGLLSSFVDRRFLVRNPLDKKARVSIKTELSPFLAERGWKIQLNQKQDQTTFGLAADNSREVEIALLPGRDFTPEEIAKAKEPIRIRTLVYADEMMIGGMTYELDPRLKVAPIERQGAKPIALDNPAIEAMLENARLLQLEEQARANGEQATIESGAFETDETGVSETADSPNDAAQLLAQLGVGGEGLGKINQVKVKKLILEVELKDE